jgi:hypothetical protein
MDTNELRNRPVVLDAGSADPAPRRRRPGVVLGYSVAALLAAAGIAAGAWSIWTAVDSTTPSGNAPQPLWFSPPAPVNAGLPSTTDRPTTTADDHGRDPSSAVPTSRGGGHGADDPTGDDHGGSRGGGHGGGRGGGSDDGSGHG